MTLRKIRAHRPDVAVADIQMPPDHTDDGLRAVLAARASQKGLGVLVLSQFLEDRYALELLAGGAEGVGYLLKEKVGLIATFTDIQNRRQIEQITRERDIADARAGEARAAQRRTIEAADASPARLTRDLHDGAQQQFLNTILNLQRAHKSGRWRPNTPNS